MSVDRPVEFSGMKFVRDDAVPVGELWIVPTFKQAPGETDAAFARRLAAATVRLINVGALTGPADTPHK